MSGLIITTYRLYGLRSAAIMFAIVLVLVATTNSIVAAEPSSSMGSAPTRTDALQYRKLPIPKHFQITRNNHTFGGDTNVGMEAAYWHGPDNAALLYNGGWLWDLKTKEGRKLPDIPAAGGSKVHRMGFYHAIPANICGDDREELVLWDPTARHIYIYTPQRLDESKYRGYVASPRQYNPRLMD